MTYTSIFLRWSSRRVGSLSLALLLSLVIPRAGAIADEAADDREQPGEVAPRAQGSARGHLIRIPLPISDAVPRVIRNVVSGALADFQRTPSPPGAPRPVLIFELDPGRTAFGQGGTFSDALGLVEFLTSRELAGVKTVAYVPRSIKGHGILVAMACEELVMAPDAEMGEAGIDENSEAPISPVVREGYRQIANRRRTIPVAVALGMLDKALEVHVVETDVSLKFALEKDLPQIREEHVIQSDEVLIRRGDWGQFSGRKARELGFAKYLVTDRNAVARALDLPPESVRDDPLLGRPIEARLIKLSGPVKIQSVGRIQRMIDDELRGGMVNFICLHIDSPGGSLDEAMNLANFLADLDRAAVRTVAYVPNEAGSSASLIAMACDHLVMTPGARLGGEGAYGFADEELAAAQQSIQELAAGKVRSWSLIAALIDPKLEVYQCTHRKNGLNDYFSDDERNAQNDVEDWDKGEKVTQDGKPLELDGTQAKQFDLAWDTVDNFDELKQAYGLQGDPRLVEPSWADFLIDALAHPGFAMLLLVIGGAAMYAELQMPGIGIGGFIAAVAFLIFFWSKYLNNTAEWLEVVLFLGGLCCLLLEIFVIPGFGIFGLGGGLMIIVSLVLASQTFVFPRTSAQLNELRNSMLVVAGAGIGIVATGAVMRRYLPHAPLFNRLMLNPPGHDELADLEQREAVVDFRHLMGAQGTAVTQLTPSGKAQVDGELLDVIAEGEVIDRGQDVVVVNVLGNRILVRVVESS